MIATNHAVTGAIIGLAVHNPLIALPVALLSHLVCDALPHFGLSKDWIATRVFSAYLVVDAALCGVLVALLFWSGSPNWLLASVCAFAAASPDFISIRKFRAARKGKNFVPNVLERFLKNIQWFERPIGAAVEAAWLVCGVIILSAIL
ncbi:hypothetical protein BH09PAT4_BH09PAT4_07430 [soil metagenome]